MKVVAVFLASLLAVAEGDAFQIYNLPAQRPSTDVHTSIHGSHTPVTTSCTDGQVLHVDGRCVTPEVHRHVHVFENPSLPQQDTGQYVTHDVPLPKVEENILFVRLPIEADDQDPIVIPPPQQKIIVYVLRKEETHNDADGVIEVPAPPKQSPDVYFVNYSEGENPILPTGQDLHSALANDAQYLQGEVVPSGSDHQGVNKPYRNVLHVDSGNIILPSSPFETGHSEGVESDSKDLSSDDSELNYPEKLPTLFLEDLKKHSSAPKL